MSYCFSNFFRLVFRNNLVVISQYMGYYTKLDGNIPYIDLYNTPSHICIYIWRVQVKSDLVAKSWFRENDLKVSPNVSFYRKTKLYSLFLWRSSDSTENINHLVLIFKKFPLKELISSSYSFLSILSLQTRSVWLNFDIFRIFKYFSVLKIV